MKLSKTRQELLSEFDVAPNWALFSQATVAAVRDCSANQVERERCYGGGVPFIKDGGRVRYSKQAILAFLKTKTIRYSTADYYREKVEQYEN